MFLEHKGTLMEISIDSYVERLLPWDLSIKHDGKIHQIRPLTMGDVLIIENIEKSKGSMAGLEKMMQVVESLFVDPKPDCSRWPFEVFMSVLVLVMNYWKDQTKKNMETVRLQIDGKTEKN
jgi:hypothetical protein